MERHRVCRVCDDARTTCSLTSATAFLLSYNKRGLPAVVTPTMSITRSLALSHVIHVESKRCASRSCRRSCAPSTNDDCVRRGDESAQLVVARALRFSARRFGCASSPFVVLSAPLFALLAPLQFVAALSFRGRRRPSSSCFPFFFRHFGVDGTSDSPTPSRFQH